MQLDLDGESFLSRLVKKKVLFLRSIKKNIEKSKYLPEDHISRFLLFISPCHFLSTQGANIRTPPQFRSKGLSCQSLERGELATGKTSTEDSKTFAKLRCEK